MKKIIVIIIFFFAIITICFFLFDWGRNNTVLPIVQQSTITTNNMPIVSAPLSNQTLTSPIQIKGTVSGNWFFESSFPIQLLDSNGELIATATAVTNEDWATTSTVDFSATLSYPKATTTDRALIVLQDANPSNDSQSSKEEFIQVILK